LPIDDQIRALAGRLGAEARRANHRLTLVLCGERDWTVAAVRAAAAGAGGGRGDESAVWLSDRALDPDARPLHAATQLLGGECGLLIYDAWSGFDPDGFGAATGTLGGGGLLVLACPPLADWPGLPDPQAARIAPWPWAAADVSGRFLARLVRVLRTAPGVTILAQGDAPAIPHPAKGPGASDSAPRPVAQSPGTQDPAEPANPDQRAAVAAILRHARGRPGRPLVLTAHRGRGKSAALGIAAARLFQSGDRGASVRNILVTAPRRSACDALFHHAALAWSGSRLNGSGLCDTVGTLRFLAPDALVDGCPPADMLLVDEAAGIPAPLLASLLATYPRLVFATTVHGYEGTGRGFDLRFRDTLDRRTPHWRALTLTTPIRWTQGDPLEALTFRALMLDAAPADAEALRGAQVRTCTLEHLDRDALAVDDETLGQVFGLLVLAHYQTRPLDLRLLLDAPGVRVLILRHGGQVAATLVAAEEGGMSDPALLRAVFDGRRRPRGHLLPQNLSAHAGLAEAPRLRYLRVIRIAVHPALGRRGLGRRLLRALDWEARQAARRGELDLLGASFGATPGLIAFWSACGYRPVQIGTHRNAASGEHALVMLRGASASGRRFIAAAGCRLEERLPVLLPGPLRRLDPGVLVALERALDPHPGSSPPVPGQSAADALEVRSFVSGHRTLEAALPALAALTRRRLGPALRAGTIGEADAALLIAATRQLRSLPELVGHFGPGGRERLLRRLREVLGLLLD